MAELGYEIKHGKHIAFEPKDKPRFYESEYDWRRLCGRTLKKRIAKEKRLRLLLLKNALEISLI